jgi:hypothetical protein
MAAAYPASSNTYVPSFDATGHLVVAFSRDPKKFPLNSYITLCPVKKDTGYYLRVTAEVAARVINGDLLREFVWHDGDDAPTGDWGNESFEFKQYATTRYAPGFRIGYKANEQADWRILALHSEFAAQLAMTMRTIRVQTALTTSGNYETGHSDTATNWGGGFFSAGTSTDPIVKEAFNAMAKKIHLASLGAVSPKDLVVIMNPTLADAIGRSQEVHAYLQGTPDSLAQVRGDRPSQNGKWGLPDHLYGYPIIIEDSVRVTSRKGAAKTAGFVQSDNDLFMVARPGGLTSVAGGPSWSSVQIFAYEEMTVESKDDADNRRIKGRVVDDYDVQVVAPATLARATNCLS